VAVAQQTFSYFSEAASLYCSSVLRRGYLQAIILESTFLQEKSVDNSIDPIRRKNSACFQPSHLFGKWPA